VVYILTTVLQGVNKAARNDLWWRKTLYYCLHTTRLLVTRHHINLKRSFKMSHETTSRRLGKGKGKRYTLQQATKAQRGVEVYLYSFLNLGVRWGGCSTPRPGRFTSRKDPVPIVQEVGWAPGPVGTGVENLVPTEIRSPDRPARSQSLYRLSYPGPHYEEDNYQII
jgi:hypothetical protein